MKQPRANHIFLAQTNTPETVIQLRLWEKNTFEYWENNSPKFHTIYSGIYKVAGDTIVLNFSKNVPKSAAKKYLFAREGLIGVDKAIILRYVNGDSNDSIKPYEMDSYFDTRFDKSKLIGVWVDEQTGLSWACDTAGSRQVSFLTPSFLTQKDLLPDFPRDTFLGSQVLQLNDTLLYLAHYKYYVNEPVFISYSVYKRIK